MEPQIRDIFAQFLELLGHEADVAADGREGLARFDPLVHEIVITDFVMPGLTGLEVAEAIRARGRADGAALPAQAGYLRAVRGGDDRGR